MSRHFNTTGPCDPNRHYMIPPERRIEGVRRLIDLGKYFVVHAPRQTGKTTLFRALAWSLTAEGKYVALHATCEEGSAFSREPVLAEQRIVRNIARQASLDLPTEFRPPAEGSRELSLGDFITAWSLACSRSVVLFLDEIDALMDEALISVLRQLRAGFPNAPRGFPLSIALIGLRDVRDYRAHIRPDQESLGTASPFNIKVESLTLENFTRGEVAELYGQHVAETGQPFEPGAINLAYDLTRGQPWLVNALAFEITFRMQVEPPVPITVAHIHAAKERLILRRDTHLDSLADKLREVRVRRVIEPILAGDLLGADVSADDVEYVLDLGLIAKNGDLEIANPMYREVIPRALTAVAEATIPKISPRWLRPDGRIDRHALLDLFIEFWREHCEAILKVAPYHEAAAQLVFMAFLHRVVNAGGTVEREYALGAGRIDLLVRWPHPSGEERLAFEIKVWRPGAIDPISRGLEQLSAYLDRLGLEEGTLVIFDRRPEAPPPGERTRVEGTRDIAGKRITILRA